MTSTAFPPAGALAIRVCGVVQGVGFRPFVHRLALRHGLAGEVRNAPGAVEIEVEGRNDQLRAFLAALEAEAPPLTRFDGIDVRAEAPHGRDDFRIVASTVATDGRLPVSPDVAMCDACEAELLDPTDRRYRYPFITCTDCGPRYTVIEAMPYDRERTSMSAFAQCPACRGEYVDPTSRRYHSQTNSCPACGPRLWLEQQDEKMEEGERSVVRAAELLVSGKIVAVRGLGGFHLAADATSDAAVERLRRRKRRDAKPLAVMVRTLAEAEALGHVGEAEREVLRSRARPVVLLRRRGDTPVAAGVAPALDTIGVMLAYTPLHHLLLQLVGRPLVMTSGNVSDEPIATSNIDGRDRLAGVADALLLHDREIVARYDDSVLRVVNGAPVFLRRARGYAPLPLTLPVPAPVPLVAVGPHLKNTFTLAEGAAAYMSQHIGDLESLETLEHFRDTLHQYRRLFRITPRVAVRDLHPGYLSTRLAEEMARDLGLERIVAVQHHHAHLAAVAAEHGVTTPVVALTFDGTGYGTDGCVWGAEVLVGDLTTFRRAGQLRYAPLPGGDLVARRPWRAALGYRSLDPGVERAFERAFDGIPAEERHVAEQQITRHLNAPLASSMGRLFDAAAAVLGVRRVARYEGQAAMELEALAGRRPALVTLPFPATWTGAGWLMDPVPLLAALGEHASRGEAIHDLAAAFHSTVACTAATVARLAADDAGLDTVVLGGGVFQNARLQIETVRHLQDAGLRVLVPAVLSPNDGAISYGQAAVAAARLAAPGGT